MRWQIKANTRLGFNSQLDLLVKPTPVPCLVLIIRNIIIGRLKIS